MCEPAPAELFRTGAPVMPGAGLVVVTTPVPWKNPVGPALSVNVVLLTIASECASEMTPMAPAALAAMRPRVAAVRRPDAFMSMRGCGSVLWALKDFPCPSPH